MYEIAILGHYYHPDLQGKETPRIHCDERNNPIEYDSLEDARAVIDEWNDDVYILSHNESGRPTYLIVANVDGDYIHDGRNGDLSNYDWDDASCTCGECNTCFQMCIAQDREYLLGSAVYKA